MTAFSAFTNGHHETFKSLLKRKKLVVGAYPRVTTASRQFIPGPTLLVRPSTSFNDTFYDNGIVGTGSALVGLEFKVTRRFSVDGDVGIRYESTLDGVDLFSSIKSGTNVVVCSNDFSGLRKINQDAGDRLIIPVTFFAS